MTHVRRALHRIAVTWLLCQAATLTLGPAAVWFRSAEQLLECKCTHGDHAICPMHHKPAPGSKVCLMTSADDSAPAVFSWLLNLGVMAAPTELVVPERRQISRLIDFTTASSRPAPPDPPPPRA